MLHFGSVMVNRNRVEIRNNDFPYITIESDVGEQEPLFCKDDSLNPKINDVFKKKNVNNPQAVCDFANGILSSSSSLDWIMMRISSGFPDATLLTSRQLINRAYAAFTGSETVSLSPENTNVTLEKLPVINIGRHKIEDVIVLTPKARS